MLWSSRNNHLRHGFLSSYARVKPIGKWKRSKKNRCELKVCMDLQPWKSGTCFSFYVLASAHLFVSIILNDPISSRELLWLTPYFCSFCSPKFLWPMFSEMNTIRRAAKKWDAHHKISFNTFSSGGNQFNIKNLWLQEGWITGRLFNRCDDNLFSFKAVF